MSENATRARKQRRATRVENQGSRLEEKLNQEKFVSRGTSQEYDLLRQSRYRAKAHNTGMGVANWKLNIIAMCKALYACGR